MNTLRHSLIIILLFIGFNAFGQNDGSSKLMIAKIDSISKVKGIKLGQVKILLVSNMFDNTQTRESNLTKAGKFHFDGQFLVIEDKYFNINKLLYFYAKDGVFEFFFQGY